MLVFVSDGIDQVTNTFKSLIRQRLEKVFLFEHLYATVINAEFIGDNFSCIQCTTLGAKENGRPTIDNNVTLGASVAIIGNVLIWVNVTIGAGSVVAKEIPDN